MRNLHTKGSDGGMWPKTRVSLTEFWGFDLGLIIFVLLQIQASWGINERVGTHVVDRPKGPEPSGRAARPAGLRGPGSREKTGADAADVEQAGVDPTGVCSDA